MKRRRIWCEFLAPEELGATATIRLLQRYRLMPIVALPPRADSPAMASALARLSGADVPLGLWPLLEDDQGYWPSARNWRMTVERTEAALRFAHRAGARVHTVAIDLEPPLAIVDQLLAGTIRRRVGAVAAMHRHALTTGASAEWRAAVAGYSSLSARLADQGLESLAVAVPPAIVDAVTGGEVCQRILSTPLFAPGWSTLTPILYTSMMASLIPGPSRPLARAVLYQASRQLRKRRRGQALCISLGVTGPGKLGHETSYDCCEQLREDVALTRSLGVDDLALFSLEGLLGRTDPDRWLETFTSAAATPAPPLVDRWAIATLGATAGATAMVARAVNPRLWKAR